MSKKIIDLARTLGEELAPEPRNTSAILRLRRLLKTVPSLRIR